MMTLGRRSFFGATVGLFAAVVTGGVIKTWKVYPARQVWRCEPLYFEGRLMRFDTELGPSEIQLFNSAPFEWAQNTTGMRP